MPQVHFVGEIKKVAPNSNLDCLSMTFGVAPGNGSWFTVGGEVMGETQMCDLTEGIATLNHPVDVHFTTSSSEGWPFFVCEVWERQDASQDRIFRGCGCVFMPTSVGRHVLEVKLWRPADLVGIAGITDTIMQQNPDLRGLRELVVKPYVRSEIATKSCGVAQIVINTVTHGFMENGVVI